MPIYLGQEVSDEYLQGLIGAYRSGYDSVLGDGSSEDADQPIIDSLSENTVLTERAAQELGETAAHAAEDGDT
jgi:hypothetical protein